MRPAVTACLLALSLAPAASASGISDANAGLATLQTGDNDGAIALFTRALGEGLRGDDQEFAYAARGKAYLNKGDLPSAIVDLDKARQMKPDDNDAQNDLIVAISHVQPASMISGRSADSYFREIGKGLGQSILSGIAQGLAQPQN